MASRPCQIRDGNSRNFGGVDLGSDRSFVDIRGGLELGFCDELAVVDPLGERLRQKGHVIVIISGKKVNFFEGNSCGGGGFALNSAPIIKSCDRIDFFPQKKSSTVSYAKLSDESGRKSTQHKKKKKSEGSR